jgi:regulatory protein
MNTHKNYTFQEAKNILERYCAYQERSHQEVRQKLQKMGMIPEVQDAVLLHLLDHDFLNEERFAKAFAGGKFRIKKWGKIKIAQALRQKGVSAANIKIGLAEIEEENYLVTLKKVAGNWVGFDKFNQMQPDKQNSNQKGIPNLTSNDKFKEMENTEHWISVIKNLAFAEKQKLIRHLQQKGFELDLIYQHIINI